MTYDDEQFTQAISYAGAFSTLARLLWIPLEEPMVQDLAEGTILDHLLEYCSALGVDASDSVARMRAATSGSRDDVVIALNVQSTRLFRTAPVELPAPPYESVWTDGEGLLGGPSTAAVAFAYRDAGLKVAEEAGAPLPDHVSREFEFLAHCARSEAQAIQAGQREDADEWHERSRHFLWEHAMRWMPLFFKAIVSDDRSEFFGALAETGLMVLESETTSSFFAEDAAL